MQKGKFFAVRTFHELGSAGLQHNGNVRHGIANHACQLEAGLGRNLAAARKFHVRHHAQQVLTILHHLLLRLLVVGAQEDLGTGAHAHQFVRNIERLAQKPSRLVDDFGINHRQEKRVIADVIFHHQHDWHAHGLGVVKNVTLVLNVVHDREQDADISLPQEDAVDIGAGIASNEVLYLAIVVGQHDYGHVEAGGLDFAGELRGVHIA